MRLGEEATFEAILADGGGIIAHLVLARAELDEDVLRIAESLCLEGVRGHHVALFSSSIHMTKLLTLVVERNPQLAVQHYIMGAIALPMLRRGDRAKWSFFFARAVRELLLTLIMAYIKCSMPGMARDMIERLFEAESNPRLPRRVLKSILHRLISDNAGANDVCSLRASGRALDHENDLLILALADGEYLKEYLETRSFEMAEQTLAVCNFLKSSPKSHIVADFASYCEGFVVHEEGERKGEYSRSIILLKSHLLLASQRLPQFLKKFLDILAENKILSRNQIKSY